MPIRQVSQGTLFTSAEVLHRAPVLASACFLGIPCRWHGRRATRRNALLEHPKEKYVLVPVCPEQLGGMPTPRSGEYLRDGTGADVLDGRLRIVDSATGQDLTEFHVSGSRYALEIAEVVGARRAFLKSGSPCCDREGVTGELLCRAGIEVTRVP
jgi:uncharacterized protein YbbK (DUF523 family)